MKIEHTVTLEAVDFQNMAQPVLDEIKKLLLSELTRRHGKKHFIDVIEEPDNEITRSA